MTPINTSLANLKIISVLDYVDGPKLVHAQSDNQDYIGIWVNDSPHEEWLYAKISQSQLELLIAGVIPITSLFIPIHQETVFRVFTGNGKDVCFVMDIGDDISNDLPPPNDFL